MQNLGGRTRIAVVSSMLVAWAALAYACSTEDENPGTTRTRDGGGGEGGNIDPQNNPDAQLGAPICGKYGGYENVKAIAASIMARAAADCRIGSPITALKPEQTQHLVECFQIQMGGAFQCPGVSYVTNTTKDSAGNKCRDMTNAHKGMNLRNADFNAFVEVVSAELADKGLSQDDIRAIAPVFEGTRTGVVQTNNQSDRNTYCACENGEYMGKPCTVDAGIIDTGLIDAAEAGDAGDSG